MKTEDWFAFFVLVALGVGAYIGYMVAQNQQADRGTDGNMAAENVKRHKKKRKSKSRSRRKSRSSEKRRKSKKRKSKSREKRRKDKKSKTSEREQAVPQEQQQQIPLAEVSLPVEANPEPIQVMQPQMNLQPPVNVQQQ